MINRQKNILKNLQIFVVLCLIVPAVHADTLASLGALQQSQFRTLSKNIAASVHYKGVTPAEALGVLGFDVGVGLGATDIDDDLFDLASEGDFDINYLLLPRLHVHKGLPFGFDIGATLGVVPGTDIQVLGAELRYALIDGGVATPAVGLRASYSRIEGADELDLNNAALDISISKGFLILTPYAGAGIVRSNANPHVGASNDSAAVSDGSLQDETFDQKKVFVGINLNFGFNVTIEADRTGDYTTYSAKAGIRF